MKSTLYTAVSVAFGAANVAAHATFQDLWINGVDYISHPESREVGDEKY